MIFKKVYLHKKIKLANTNKKSIKLSFKKNKPVQLTTKPKKLSLINLLQY